MIKEYLSDILSKKNLHYSQVNSCNTKLILSPAKSLYFY